MVRKSERDWIYERPVRSAHRRARPPAPLAAGDRRSRSPFTIGVGGAYRAVEPFKVHRSPRLRPLALEDGPIQPLLEADLAELRVVARNQRALAEFGTEVARVDR